MTKKGLCVVTKNQTSAYNFQTLLEEKTKVRWASGSLPTQVYSKYKIFYIEPNPYNPLNVLTGATYEDLRNYGLFENLMQENIIFMFYKVLKKTLFAFT